LINPTTMTARIAFCFGFLSVVLLFATSCEDNHYPVSGIIENDPDQLSVNVIDFGYGDDLKNRQATIGRVLFYDKLLSANNNISCGSCHKQSLAFSDNVRFSEGTRGGITLRNSMPIQNLEFLSPIGSSPAGTTDNGYGAAAGSDSFAGIFFWDGHQATLEAAVGQPLKNHLEMGDADFASKIQERDFYRYSFKKIQSQNIEDDVVNCLAAFIGAIKSDNSRYDQYLAGDKNVLMVDELEGMRLFKTKYNCASCHQIDASTHMEARFVNIGLDAQYVDPGLSGITNSSADEGKFKVPDLHNVALTAPYMHDGRFATLEEVIDHYSNGIVNHPNLHPELKDENGNALRMNVTPDEVREIIAFLKTFNVGKLTTDQRYSDPFASSK
jgi:cytochrome c peroxidase